MSRILVIDDDRELAELLEEYLVPEGFSIDTAFDHSSGLAKALKSEDDLIVLDVMLPGGSGFELLKKLRAAGTKVPVILLTARGEAIDRIVGLEIGADDYLPKPFDPRELVARIRAILRRTHSSANNGSQEDNTSVGDITLSPGNRTVVCAGQEVDLTSVEFNVLELLLRNAGTVVTREELAQTALGRPLAPFDRSVDVHVSKLRKKLGGSEEDSENRIKTVRGVGYIFASSPARRQNA